MAKNWSDSEVEAIVEDYFDMLACELVGKPYNKAEHNRALRDRLDGRSHGSVERKHQNISAVLIDMGIPYIEGYKPLGNFQRVLLPEAVADYLAGHPDVPTLLSRDADAPISSPSVTDFLSAWEEAPKPTGGAAARGSDATAPTCPPTPLNYLACEARNQALGKAGERFVVNFERARLIHCGREGLSDRIEHVSETVGPAAGYDIRSFETDGADLFIEAKTTKYGKYTPFFLTEHERGFSERNRRHYALYRVFRFRAKPGLFALRGFLEDHCSIAPSQYVARVG